ncbi:hypothetical protein ACFWP5_08915 [Streptomyces sp. NPDC058469]|uniref:hypothetical protein n=1 Tax=Streptomyces sp. NPDC058469 TaxID=3346514 RepID=UPI0036596A48
MTIDEAFKAGHTKLRLEKWALPEDHIELYDAGNGYLGPWVHFHSPLLDKPHPIFIGDAEQEIDWVPYSAALPPQPQPRPAESDAAKPVTKEQENSR